MPKPRRATRSRVCFFDTNDIEPYYREVDVLSKFISERKKILPAQYTGVCSKHQRRMATAIKQARHLALLPFVNQL